MRNNWIRWHNLLFRASYHWGKWGWISFIIGFFWFRDAGFGGDGELFICLFSRGRGCARDDKLGFFQRWDGRWRWWGRRGFSILRLRFPFFFRSVPEQFDSNQQYHRTIRHCPRDIYLEHFLRRVGIDCV
jgi:hypothetical protein